MTIPRQKPGKSKQDVQTPPELLAAICREFHVIEWSADLAANESNAVCGLYFGPGSQYGEDSLSIDWPEDGDLWLNPEFADIDPWAEKCAAYGGAGRVFMLVPASVGANWYRDHVEGKAHVVALSPRVQFVGHTSPYPKDLLLCVFGGVRGGFSTWRWKP